MGLYEKHVLPHVIHCACTSPPIQKLRKSIVPKASGRVLEVGMGSGTNLEFYDSNKTELIWGLEPSEAMRQKARKNLMKTKVPVKWLGLPGEEIPLDDECVDTVLLTFTLCTIPDYETALKQMHRVLKPNGKLIFCEHGLAQSSRIQACQNRLNPYWSSLAGGCNLNRPIDQLLERANFNILELKTHHLNKLPKFVSYIYQGVACKL